MIGERGWQRRWEEGGDRRGRENLRTEMLDPLLGSFGGVMLGGGRTGAEDLCVPPGCMCACVSSVLE